LAKLHNRAFLGLFALSGARDITLSTLMSLKSFLKSKLSTSKPSSLTALESHLDTKLPPSVTSEQIDAAIAQDEQEEDVEGLQKLQELEDTHETLDEVIEVEERVGVVVPSFEEYLAARISDQITLQTQQTQQNQQNHQNRTASIENGSKWLHRLRKHLRSLHLPTTPQTAHPVHVTQEAERPEIAQAKHAIIIGIHGWFPRPSLLKLIGEPTGTSSKFAEMTYSALKAHLGSSVDVRVFAMSQQGRVEARVEGLFAHLKRYRDEFQRADVVLFAAHSQGVVVATHVLSQLLDHRILDTSITRVGLLAMAGICHGPFPHLRTNPVIKYFERSAARELFEYCLVPEDGNASWRFEQALRNILVKSVRFTAVGGWKDQVVGLYSALLSRYSSPNVYRCVFVPNEDYDESDFLIKLVHWCVMRRNRGLYDGGLLVHLSEALGGDLLAGKGHSTLYEELSVYKTAIDWTFSDAMSHSTKISNDFQVHDLYNVKDGRTASPNPFALPWIMAKLIDEDDELKSIALQFASWFPTSPRAKEMRYRLEPLLLLNKL